jgi:hypothetical protein
MPYIPKVNRNRDTRLHPKTPGELNWVLSETIKYYLADHRLSYQTINDIVGALESCKLEFYRRIAAPLENHKISENGDVY